MFRMTNGHSSFLHNPHLFDLKVFYQEILPGSANSCSNSLNIQTIGYQSSDNNREENLILRDKYCQVML